MIIIEGPRRIERPQWERFALLAEYALVVGDAAALEGQILNIMGEVVCGHFGGRA